MYIWLYSKIHNKPCKVINKQSLWGETVYQVWLPDDGKVVSLREDQVQPIDEQATLGSDHIEYIVTAARIADALTKDDVFLAPIESAVMPLPHQIKVLSRTTSDERVRFLLADEVGLGKTIEAVLIMKELKLRGLVKRTLVLVPSGLTNQWVSEMQVHFGEDFVKINPSNFAAIREFTKSDNLWNSHDQVICSMDSVKPIEKRRGWSAEQVALYNKNRFEDLVTAGWDLVIVDEAHRLGGSSEQVARYKLGRGLSDAAPYLLLLSATPHQGKTDAFHRLISILDPDNFPDTESVTRERVSPYVVRTEKRVVIDHEGNKLFRPRKTQLIPISWQPQHEKQRLLYDAVTEYVREGYNQAVLEKKSYIGFLMILMQRLVVSSTRAIRHTLERRLESLEVPQEQMSLFPEMDMDELLDMDGQEQVDSLLGLRLKALNNERDEVKLLLSAAKECEQVSVDAKAEALLDWIYQLQREENDPELKILVFTAFLPTQQMLKEFLTSRGISVVCLNGTMSIEDRQKAQKKFASEVRMMISTEAGGEGLNLQFCHVVINYDLPWNPMKLEQRIGRVDRIGQKKDVRAINFIFEDTVEFRVREVLEEKLRVILEEFGVDKTSDVLDSVEAGQMFDDLYIQSIANPKEIDAKVQKVVDQIKTHAETERDSSSLIQTEKDISPDKTKEIVNHPLPHWVQKMTLSYLRGYGGQVCENKKPMNLTWPDGKQIEDVVFTVTDADRYPVATHLTLENSRIRGLVKRMPSYVPIQSIPIVSLVGIPGDVKGVWSLWQIGI